MGMETAQGFYGPWLELMLWVGLPLLVAGTVAMVQFERGSFLRWATGGVALIGWALVLTAGAVYLILQSLQSAFSNLPGM